MQIACESGYFLTGSPAVWPKFQWSALFSLSYADSPSQVASQLKRQFAIVENARQLYIHTWQWASGHVRSRSEECMWRVLGGWRKLKKKITRFSFPLLLNLRKKYFTNPSCLPHWQRKTSPRSTALVSRIGLQPFLRTRWYPALVPCSATAVEADFGVQPKVRQYTRQVLKRTESFIVPKTSHTQALGSADAAEK